MKHGIIAMTILCLALPILYGGCVSKPRTETIHMSDEEFLQALDPFLAEGERIEDISTEAPEPGYLSGLELLKWLAETFEQSGRLDPISLKIYINNKLESLDQRWILDTKVHVPILVYNLNENASQSPRGYDYCYFVYASHPIMGTVYEGFSFYNENTGNLLYIGMDSGLAVSRIAHKYWQQWETSGLRTRHIISKYQAKEYFARTVGTPTRGDPIAVNYAWNRAIGRYHFYWYFETEARSAGGAEGYIMDSLLFVESSADLKDPLGYMQRANTSYRSAGNMDMPTVIAKLPEPLGLYDAIENRARQASSGPLNNSITIRPITADELQPVR